MSTQYKYEEIRSHFTDFIHDENNQEYVKDHHEDLHQEIFNNDYYLIGREKAREWLGDQAFNVINIIKEYENDNFGKVTTDFSEPEKVVNMYTFIIGEQIVQDYYKNPESFKKVKMYSACVRVEGLMHITCEATSEKEALEKFKDHEYEEDDSFSLQDCEQRDDLISLSDIDEL
jgi:hypothetical protein